MSDNVTLTTTLKTLPPFVRGVDFVSIKQTVLGRRYELSLVFIGNTRSRTLNRTYRKKDKPTNVLVFPFSETEGEIFITVPYAVQEAKDSDISPREHVVYLFIHGLLHLKGLKHGDTMEQEEKRLVKKFTA